MIYIIGYSLGVYIVGYIGECVLRIVCIMGKSVNKW